MRGSVGLGHSIVDYRLTRAGWRALRSDWRLVAGAAVESRGRGGTRAAGALDTILGRMNREHHRNYSHELQRDMEALVFGHAGRPLLVFPSSQGRFFEYEDAGMIRTLAPKIDAGQLQVFCVDSVDSESLYNKN